MRLELQEQGRAAAARRRHRLPAQPARRAAGRGPRARQGRRRRRRPAERHASDDEPFAALAFKIMADPYVGKLTYFRVYSGKLRGRLARAQRDHRPHRADRPHPDDARQRARGARGGLRRRHRRRRRHQAGRHRRHAGRARQADQARDDRVPRARHQGGDRAQDQGRPGEDVGRARPPGRGGPHLPGPHQRGDRPDRDLRDGRAAPRGAGRPDDARVQGRRQRRPPAGLLPGDDPRHRREGRGPLRAPDRWLGPVRHRLHQRRAGARRGL